jgi:hypothetical protein
MNGFFINRLLRMSPAEIIYRIGQKGQTRVERAMKDRYQFNEAVLEEKYKLFNEPVTFTDYSKIIKKADDVCANRFDIFALKDYQIEGKIDYHKDYKSGRSAPKHLFGKSINYRDSDKIGDIKYIWELNRHLFMVPLALACQHTKQSKYMEKFESLLTEWILQNPFMMGVNWSSSLELGIRLINWTICWHIIGDELKPELKKRWLDTIYRHCWFINRNLSAFSSANNHLIGEAAGLFIGSAAMPRFKASKRWRGRAYRILIRESMKQNYPDGVNKEQAISYQQFVLDFLILSGLAGEANGVKYPLKFWGIIEKMLDYLAAIEDAGGNIPQIGDEDDGYVVDLFQKEIGAYHSLLHTGAYIFKREEFLKGSMAAKSNKRDNGDIDCMGPDYKTLLLLNIRNVHIEEVGLIPGNLPDSFTDGGYYILGADFHTPSEQKLIFDCGSLGYLSLAAHGHADALAVYFSAGGRPIFIDPGTYAYHADEKWRNYFRSTAAHNTVRMDGRDQSVMSGNFMWSSKAETEIIDYKGFTKAKGLHTGYKSFNDSVLHTRTVKYEKETDHWEIEDQILCEGSHNMEIFFHIHPECCVENTDEMLMIYFEQGCCLFEKDSRLELQIHKGDEAFPSGWYSPSYDVKVPTTTLRLFKSIKGPIEVATKFSIVFNP